MLRNLSLNTKLMVSLIGLQACLLGLGAIWIVNWEEKLKYQELEQQLELQADAIEDMITIKGNRLVFPRGGEVAQELDHDNDTYFLLLSESNDFIDDSKGPSDKSKARLKAEFSRIVNSVDSEQYRWIDNGKWFVLSEPIAKESGAGSLHGMLYLAVNARTTLKSIAELKAIAVFSASTMLVVTSLGIFLVVSFSTRNLNKFAVQLTALRSPSHVPDIDLVPQSTQEKMLFDGYRAMAKSIRSTLDYQRLFIANASHELKTPIAAGLAALEVTLSKPRMAEDYERTCRDVMAELHTLRRLSTVLLDIASLDEVALDVSESCDINFVISQVVERWKQQANKKGIQLLSNRHQNSCDSITGSFEKWEVIVGNLVDNAIKYGRANGHVWIDARKVSPNRSEICIRDDGPGMSDDDIAQLGKMFYRADPSRSDQNSFGLGFAHARRLVEYLGGSVYVRNEGGIEVIITLLQKNVPSDFSNE